MHSQPNPPVRVQLGQARYWRYSAAALSLTAGLIHIIAAPEHFEEWLGYGLFFFIVASAQILYALILLVEEPRRAFLVAGLFGNAAIIALYIVTRTIGIPFFGPRAGEVEVVGALDLISKIVELALIVCLTMMLRSPLRSARRE